jgi:hypothetical protein
MICSARDPEIPEEILQFSPVAYGDGTIEGKSVFLRCSLLRRIQQLLIRRPFRRNLLYKLFLGNQPLLNQELRQCISLRKA